MTRVISTSVNGIKTYHITAESALPSHFGNRANRRIGTHSELKNRVSLIQEFEFTGSSRLIKLSDDGITCAVSGEYPPQIKIFDLDELSQVTTFMTRRVPAHFEMLTESWDKLAVLRSDRKFDLYNKGGLYHSQDLPIRCRHFLYNPATADIVMASEESQLLRLNLEYGRFMESIPTGAEAGNVVVVSDVHQLIACGYEGGMLEFFDPRDKRSLAAVQLQADVTALRFDSTGMMIGTGLGSGDVLLFDIRSATPVLKYSHRNQSPVHSIHFHSSRKLVSGDRKGCRIYDLDDNGKFFTSFETKSQMNSVIPYPGSGLLFAGTDTEKVQVMLIPDLGPAPRQFSFLDNLILDVEAADEDETPLYEDQKFVTREELENFGLAHLVKTSVLKPYMHGFFVPKELYRLMTDKGEVQGYDEWVRQLRRNKKDEEQKEQVATNRKVQKPDEDLSKLSKRQAKKRKEIMRDSYYQDAL